MNATGLFDIIRIRRSIRHYRDQPVPVEVLHRLLDAARWAPSAHNRQPWRFVVITERARRESLARAMGERFRSDLAADGVPGEYIDRQVGRSRQRISTAPALVVVCLSMADMDRYPDARRQNAERTMAVQSVALAVQNLLLMAHAEGLGACWMCAPLFCADVVRDELSLAADWEAQALITIGYPAEERESKRQPLETVTLWY
ncbi:MAG: nitroreductase family protein [Chloroflexi bacterium]|nr:nitroreductase family protein [Chloroflexota bacterium]